MYPGFGWFRGSDDVPDADQYPDGPNFDESGPDTIRCAKRGADVYDDAVQCPSCGCYVMEDTSPWAGRSLWWIVLGLLGFAAIGAALIGWRRW
ncbi:MAG: hypothetical protein ACUVUC_12875 [Thermoguttaceae bacterium]